MSDSVGKIHGRFYLTLIHPSSYKTSLLFMLIFTSVISILINMNNLDELAYRLPSSVILAYLLIQLDYKLLKNIETVNRSKVHHIAFFAMTFWLITILLGILASAFFANTIPRYIVEGMMLLIGFRLSIFRAVFGVSFVKASVIAPIMPLVLFIAVADIQLLFDPQALLFGSLLLAIAIVWSILADRAGRPWLDSTFKLLQAYLLAWSENNPKHIEEMMSGKANNTLVKTRALMLDNIALVLPEIHPGPFNPVGGSNLPAEIHEYYSKHGVKSMIMHSISDHAMNIPSRDQVSIYLKSLDNFYEIDKSDLCSEPIVITVNKARVTGLAFNNNALLMLSLSPYGMEDVEEDVKDAIEEYAKRIGINVLLVDTHNALGRHLSDKDKEDMIKAAKDALEKLSIAKQYPFMVGSADSREIKFEIEEDIGNGGLSVLAIKVNNNIYTIGWADANNMKLGLREHIVKYLDRNGIKMLEVCTSDTHATSGRARNRDGYYTLGSVSNWDNLSNAFLQLARLAISRLRISGYKLLVAESKLMLMGSELFDDYSKALDKSLNLTKVTLMITVAVYIIMLII